MNTMGDRVLASSAGCSRCLFAKDHRRRQVVGSGERQKVIHRGSKKATVQAGKRANNVVSEIRQEVDDRQSVLVRRRTMIHVRTNMDINRALNRTCNKKKNNTSQ